ncbi:MAG: hypothetical protein IPP29_22990 [Bacteroidetes bacterium]|nr:hypothetical protein [Bacteroidota bacterium]
MQKTPVLTLAVILRVLHSTGVPFLAYSDLDSALLDLNNIGNISVTVKIPNSLGGCSGTDQIVVNFSEPVQTIYMSQDSAACSPNSMAIVQHLEANGPIRYVWGKFER